MGRLKTGTPPRLIKRSSIDFTQLESQKPDNSRSIFLSFIRIKYITVMIAISRIPMQKRMKSLETIYILSAMYSGNIKGVGPRYCPSIEDKIADLLIKPSIIFLLSLKVLHVRNLPKWNLYLIATYIQMELFDH